MIASKIQGDAGIECKMDIAGCTGVGFCSGDGQASFTDNKSPEINENKKTVLPVCWGMWGLKR